VFNYTALRNLKNIRNLPIKSTDILPFEYLPEGVPNGFPKSIPLGNTGFAKVLM